GLEAGLVDSPFSCRWKPCWPGLTPLTSATTCTPAASEVKWTVPLTLGSCDWSVASAVCPAPGGDGLVAIGGGAGAAASVAAGAGVSVGSGAFWLPATRAQGARAAVIVRMTLGPFMLSLLLWFSDWAMIADLPGGGSALLGGPRQRLQIQADVGQGAGDLDDDRGRGVVHGEPEVDLALPLVL